MSLAGWLAGWASGFLVFWLASPVLSAQFIILFKVFMALAN